MKQPHVISPYNGEDLRGWLLEHEGVPWGLLLRLPRSYLKSDSLRFDDRQLPKDVCYADWHDLSWRTYLISIPKSPRLADYRSREEFLADLDEIARWDDVFRRWLAYHKSRHRLFGTPAQAVLNVLETGKL